MQTSISPLSERADPSIDVLKCEARASVWQPPRPRRAPRIVYGVLPTVWAMGRSRMRHESDHAVTGGPRWSGVVLGAPAAACTATLRRRQVLYIPLSGILCVRGQ
eukprot:1448944-Prymnesium_polylepis.1